MVVGEKSQPSPARSKNHGTLSRDCLRGNSSFGANSQQSCGLISRAPTVLDTCSTWTIRYIPEPPLDRQTLHREQPYLPIPTIEKKPLCIQAQEGSALHAFPTLAPRQPCPFSWGSARVCVCLHVSTHPPPGGPSVLVAAHFTFVFVRLFFSSPPSSTPPWLRKTRHGTKNRMLWVFLSISTPLKSSDSDRGPPMRGVDSRGGGFSGNSGNPPPAGGRGRGMVLPAWLVAQQNAQMAGPVSKLLPPSTLLRPVRALAEERSESTIMLLRQR